MALPIPLVDPVTTVDRSARSYADMTQRMLPLARLEIQVQLAERDLARAIASAGRIPAARGANPQHLWSALEAAMRACADAAGTSPAGTASDLHLLRDGLARVAASTPQPGPVLRAHAAVFTAEASRASGRRDLAAWDAASANGADATPLI